MPIINIILTTEVPKIVSNNMAKISSGIAINTSTVRLSNWSIQPPTAAASSPQMLPRKKANKVVTSAIPTVFLAP